MGEDILTPTKIPSPLTTNLKNIEIEVVRADLEREYIDKLWCINYFLGEYKMEILLWKNSRNHFTFNIFVRLSKRFIIPKNIINIRNLPPCVTCLYWKSHQIP